MLKFLLHFQFFQTLLSFHSEKPLFLFFEKEKFTLRKHKSQLFGILTFFLAKLPLNKLLLIFLHSKTNKVAVFQAEFSRKTRTKSWKTGKLTFSFLLVNIFNRLWHELKNTFPNIYLMVIEFSFIFHYGFSSVFSATPHYGIWNGVKVEECNFLFFITFSMFLIDATLLLLNKKDKFISITSYYTIHNYSWYRFYSGLIDSWSKSHWIERESSFLDSFMFLFTKKDGWCLFVMNFMLFQFMYMLGNMFLYAAGQWQSTKMKKKNVLKE